MCVCVCVRERESRGCCFPAPSPVTSPLAPRHSTPPPPPLAQVVYDPAKISFVDILRWFWEAHDPTSGMGQGNDRGTQARPEKAKRVRRMTRPAAWARATTVARRRAQKKPKECRFTRHPSNDI